MAVVEYQTQASADDAWQRTGAAPTWDYTEELLRYGKQYDPEQGGMYYNFYCRWQLNIPANATITQTRLKVYPSVSLPWAVTHTLKYVDERSCGPLTSAPTLGGTGMDYVVPANMPANTWYTIDTDVKNIVIAWMTAILGGRQYEPGDYLGLGWVFQSASDFGAPGQLRSWDYDDHSKGPILVVEYSVPATAGIPIPLLNMRPIGGL